jgi:hypothetical protein
MPTIASLVRPVPLISLLGAGFSGIADSERGKSISRLVCALRTVAKLFADCEGPSRDQYHFTTNFENLTECKNQASRASITLSCQNTSLDHLVKLEWFCEDIAKNGLNQRERGLLRVPGTSRTGHYRKSRLEMSENSLDLWISELQNFFRVESRMKMRCMIWPMNWNGGRFDVKCAGVEK